MHIDMGGGARKGRAVRTVAGGSNPRHGAAAGGVSLNYTVTCVGRHDRLMMTHGSEKQGTIVRWGVSPHIAAAGRYERAGGNNRCYVRLCLKEGASMRDGITITQGPARVVASHVRGSAFN